jgi:hypothetical protein
MIVVEAMKCTTWFRETVVPKLKELGEVVDYKKDIVGKRYYINELQLKYLLLYPEIKIARGFVWRSNGV